MFYCLLQKIENKRTRELNEEEMGILREEILKYKIEGDLVRGYQRNKVAENTLAYIYCLCMYVYL